MGSDGTRCFTTKLQHCRSWKTAQSNEIAASSLEKYVQNQMLVTAVVFAQCTLLRLAVLAVQPLRPARFCNAFLVMPLVDGFGIAASCHGARGTSHKRGAGCALATVVQSG